MSLYFKVMFLPIMGALVAACVPQTRPNPAPDLARCNAGAVQALHGKPASQIAALGLPNVIRILPPGAVMTMDYHATRINVTTDKAGNIEKVTCG